MKQSKITTAKIKELAKQKLRNGETKQSVYNSLCEHYNQRKEIANIIRYIPDNYAIKKYGWLNIILLIYVSFLTLVVALDPNFSLIYLAWLLYITATKKYQLFYWHIMFGILILIISAGLLFWQLAQSLQINIEISIALISSGSLLILGAWIITKKLTPPYKETREKYQNANNETKIRVIHHFD
jgi:hypothetical protein